MILDQIELDELDKLADMRLCQPWGIQRSNDSANFDRMARLSKSAVGQIHALNGTVYNLECGIQEQIKTIEKFRKALIIIADYDKVSKQGICPYGCDCPDIAQRTLKDK